MKDIHIKKNMPPDIWAALRQPGSHWVTLRVLYHEKKSRTRTGHKNSKL